MEFLVEFDVNVPDGAPCSEVEERQSGEAAAAAKLAEGGHLLRIWKPPVAPGESKALGLYRADSQTQLDGLLGALPLADWMRVTVTPLEPHPNDPANRRPSTFRLPGPRLTPVYRLEATLGSPLDLGDTAQGHRPHHAPDRRDVHRPRDQRDARARAPAPTGRSSCRTGPRSATSATRCRPTAATCSYVQSRGVRHGTAEVLARLGRGEDVDASEYTFRTSTQIETAAPRSRLAEQGRLHQRRRPPGRGRGLRDLPRRMKVAVITGASRGIGAGLAVAFRRAGYAVVAPHARFRPPTSPTCSPCEATSRNPRLLSA